MTRRRHKFIPAPPPDKALPRLCIAQGCGDQALSWSECCEAHYDDELRWKSTPENWKHSAGLSITPMFVYFVRAEVGENLIKIGRTKNHVDKRLSDARTFCPYPITLLACVATELWVEAALHFALVEHRVRGEWFLPHADVLTVVETAKQSEFMLRQYARPFASAKGPLGIKGRRRFAGSRVMPR